MQIPESKDELRRRRLRLTGRKRELVARLLAALHLEREHGGREEVRDDNDDDDLKDVDGGVRVTSVMRRPRQDEPKHTVLTFKGVENSIEKFSGDDLLNISRRIKDFEEMAEACGLGRRDEIIYYIGAELIRRASVVTKVIGHPATSMAHMGKR